MNKRAYVRVSLGGAARIEVHVMGDGFLEVCHARDISEGGIGIYLPNPFEGCGINSAVKLVIRIGREKSFVAEAVIRHAALSKKGFFGVEFTKLPPQGLEQIRQLVQQRLAQGGSSA